MRIMLVTPASPRAPDRWMPVGLCSIAAALLAQHHQVSIFDRYVVAMHRDLEQVNHAMIDAINQFHPEIIGFSTYTPLIFDTIDAARAARSVHQGLIVLGGHHATALPRLTLERISEADAVIVGEAELAFCQLANGEPYPAIGGLFWREPGKGIQASPIARASVNLEDLPLPAYHLLDMTYYTKKNISTIRPFYLAAGSILSSRGCYNRCAYCTESLTFARGVRHHSVDFVIDNIKLLVHDYHCNGITFLDNNFLADRKSAEAIFNKIIEHRLNESVIFCVQVRADDIDAEIARMMRQAGCRKVEIGLETYDQPSLDRMHKNQQIETVAKAIGICKANDINVQANLIMGLIGETLPMLEATLEWVRQLQVDTVKWGLLQLYPGSELYEQEACSFFETNEWTRETIETFYRTSHVAGLSADELQQWRLHRLMPWQRRMHHKGILMHNPVIDSCRYYIGRLIDRNET